MVIFGCEYGRGEDSEALCPRILSRRTKSEWLEPDIIAQQSGKDNNPHKTKHVDANNKFLGKGTVMMSIVV